VIPARSTVAPVEIVTGAGRLRAAAASEQGPYRKDNQDMVVLAPLPNGLAGVIADGMGGQKGGGEAAEAAVGAAMAALLSGADVTDAMAAAATAVDGVKAALGDRPGTTLIAAVLSEAGLRLAHVGDSRAYLLRDGAIEQLTEDHSWTAEEVRAGRLTAEQAAGDNRRNLITRALIGEPVEPQLVVIEPLPRGAWLLLCTDGLWDPLEDRQIADIAGGEGSVEQRLTWLVGAALDAGSRDNITALLVDLA
jgi:serine/threonine protein phosphatase PrpC